MSIILGLHPEIVPPATGLMVHGWGFEYEVVGGLSNEAVAVGTWLASVLFSACVCFGNIGRQLALSGKGDGSSLTR
jgi:Insulin-induced protein (INSIG)